MSTVSAQASIPKIRIFSLLGYVEEALKTGRISS